MVSQVKAEDGIQLLQTYTGSGWLEVCLQRLQTVANGLIEVQKCQHLQGYQNL